jgi:hypothetical protein
VSLDTAPQQGRHRNSHENSTKHPAFGLKLLTRLKEICHKLSVDSWGLAGSPMRRRNGDNKTAKDFGGGRY